MKNKLIKASLVLLMSAGVSAVTYASSSYVAAPTYTHSSGAIDLSPATISMLRTQPAMHNIHQVNNLRKAQAEYQGYVSQGGWKAIRSGDKIEPGDSDPRIPALRQRLRAEGYESVATNYALIVTTAQEETVFDDDLADLVKTFQARHGLDDDGVIGPATLKALNESAESKLNRIEVNLTNWADYEALGETHIWANIPSFNVQAWKNDTLDIEMNTVVGARYTQTPAFSDEVEYMVANPKWFLPTSLFKRQKLKKLQADPSYAAKFNYRIYDRASGEEVKAASVDWFEPGISSKIQMVQDAGPNNALGNIKIIFPNSNAIYLHGTPDQHLFAKSNRALSSGCIRLEDPTKMAQWIAENDERVEAKEFKEILDAKTRKHFPLAEHIPVHITYMTVTADETGKASFWQDVYKKQDAPILVSNEYMDYEAPNEVYQTAGTDAVIDLN
ncbi:L,D-transpeptidase family protein [Hellea sp.]|nr:L,D-transpeptidase family protein [Hellea sp.]